MCVDPTVGTDRSALLRRRPDRCNRIVVEDRGEPLLAVRNRPSLASGIVLDLVAFDLADAEIMAVRVTEIQSADRRARPHGKAFGERHADLAWFEQREQRRLLGVIRLGWITRRGADAAILFRD